MMPAWQPQQCYALMDCDCCGARGARICLERPHEGAHAFVCRACGTDLDCA